MHSKRAVIDDDTIMIGTYNVDPRSANLNAELLVVCQGSTALATQMHEDLMRPHQPGETGDPGRNGGRIEPHRRCVRLVAIPDDCRIAGGEPVRFSAVTDR